jgi:predicted nuclease with TOPRIM domain
MSDNILTLLVTVIGVLGSSAAWRFYEKKLAMSSTLQTDEIKTGHLFREDLQDRVSNLETKLAQSAKDKDDLQLEIKKLTQATSALKVEVEFLRKENALLRQLYERAGGTLPVIPPRN